MKNKHFLLYVLLLPLIASCQDFTDDESTKKFFCKKKGYHCENLDDICLDRPSSLTDVIVLGTFAHDYGCMGESLIVGGKMGDWKNMMKAAASANGWNDEGKREEVAVKLLTGIRMVFKSVITEDQTIEHKDAQPLYKPKVEIIDGQVHITYWMMQPPGMMPEDAYSNFKLTLDVDGSFLKSELLGGFSVPIN